MKEIVAYDYSEGMIEHRKSEKRDQRVNNVTFEVSSVEDMNFKVKPMT